MMTRIRRGLAWALCLSALVAISVGAARDDGALVRIEPAAGAYAVGETFAVEVRIEDVAELYGADVRVAFDPSRLEVVEPEVTLETDLLSPPWLVLFNEVDNEAGTIVYVTTLLNPNPPISGSGALFSFHFRTLAAGSTRATITAQTLTDIDGELITAATAGAFYRVGHQIFLPLVAGQSSHATQGGIANSSSWHDAP